MTKACIHCADLVGDADKFCHSCGFSLRGDGSASTRALVPTAIRSGADVMALLPAVRADLAPFAPALRSAATVLATAALADLAARYAAPALARKAVELIRSGGRRERVIRTTMVEQRIVVRQWTSVRS